MAGVRVLEQDRLVPEPIWRKLASISDREREVLRRLDELVSGAAPLSIDPGDELLQGQAPGLDVRVLKQLARG